MDTFRPLSRSPSSASWTATEKRFQNMGSLTRPDVGGTCEIGRVRCTCCRGEGRGTWGCLRGLPIVAISRFGLNCGRGATGDRQGDSHAAVYLKKQLSKGTVSSNFQSSVLGDVVEIVFCLCFPFASMILFCGSGGNESSNGGYFGAVRPSRSSKHWIVPRLRIVKCKR